MTVIYQYGLIKNLRMTWTDKNGMVAILTDSVCELLSSTILYEILFGNLFQIWKWLTFQTSMALSVVDIR